MEISLNRNAFNEVLEGYAQGYYFSFGTLFAQKSLVRRSHRYRSTFNGWLTFGGTADRQTLYLPLSGDQHSFSVCKVAQDIVSLKDADRDLLLLAKLGGILRAPADFSGALVYEVHYEKIFPAAPVLSSITGLMLCGYLDGITDWSALGHAQNLRHLAIDGGVPQAAAHLAATPVSLSVTAGVFMALPAFVLNEVQVLHLRNADATSLRHALTLPSVTHLRATVQLKGPGLGEPDAMLQWFIRLARALDAQFPEWLAPAVKPYYASYPVGSGADESLTRQRLGGGRYSILREDRTLSWNDDISVYSHETLTMTLRGVKGIVLIAESTQPGCVSLQLAGSHEDVLKLSGVLFGLPTAIPRRAKEAVPVKENKNTAVTARDLNRENFEIQRDAFARVRHENILPILQSAVRALQSLGIGAECRESVDHGDNPMYYQASVFLTLWTKGRGQWAVFQYSHSSNRLDPVNFHVWNPKKWENSDRYVSLETLTAETVNDDLGRFLRSVADYFGYKTPEAWASRRKK